MLTFDQQTVLHTLLFKLRLLVRNKFACVCITIVYTLFSVAHGLPARATTTDSATEQVSPDAPLRSGPVVLLGVFANEKSDRSLREAVIDRLTRLGEDVTPAVDSPELVDCKQAACYTEVSLKTNVQRLLRVDVYESRPRRYYLEGALFEQQTGNTRTAKSSCEDCSSESLRTALGDMTVRIVAGGEPAQRVHLPEKSEITPPAPPVIAASLVTPRRRWRPERIGLVALLSTLTATTLVGTILLPSLAPSKDSNFCSVDSGIKPTSDNFRCVSMTSWTIGGTILTALSTSSLALTVRQFLRKDATAY